MISKRIGITNKSTGSLKVSSIRPIVKSSLNQDNKKSSGCSSCKRKRKG